MSFRAKNPTDKAVRPMEALLGLRYALPPGLALEGGAGVGLSVGAGAPDLRLFLGLSYAFGAGGAPPRSRGGSGRRTQAGRPAEAPRMNLAAPARVPRA